MSEFVYFSDVGNCARCGGNHKKIGFRLLTNPILDFTHFAICPTNDEPILMQFVETKDSE